MAVTETRIGNINAVFARGNNVGSYLSTGYFIGPSPGSSGTFPSSNLNLNLFLGTAPTNEWACVCVCACTNCGK